MKETISLRPDRKLVNPDFTGYNIAFDNIPTYEKALEKPLHCVSQSEDQFSFGHVQILSLHNHLHGNPHCSDFVYFVDSDWVINQVSLGLMNRMNAIVPVCQIPKPNERDGSRFPVTIKFASAERAVIADGVGTFHVATVKKDKWMIIFSDTLPINSVLLSAVQSEEHLSFLTRSVLEPKFESLLHHFVLDQHWKTTSQKSVVVPGSLKYASVESSNSLVVVSSGSKLPKFMKQPSSRALTESEPKYKWCQSPNDVTIIINVQDIPETEITVTITENHLKVIIKGETIIDGEFVNKVGTVMWRVADGKLEINGAKDVVGFGWSRVIVDDDCGQQFQPDDDGDGVESPFNAEELEDVDCGPADNLVRLNVQLENVSHQVDNAQFLFPVAATPEKPAALCLRLLTDPDACVWQFEDSDQSWTNKHIETFSAFGYVQAGKPERKFMVAPPDMSYVVLAYAFRYLFMFRQPSAVEGELRNRSSGRRVKTVAKQQVINLQTEEEVLGLHATNSVIFVLTKSNIYNLVVN